MTPEEGRTHLAARLAAVGRGERSALREVYELTSAKLFGVCLRILPDREEAEDVLQDVYLAVWNKADRFDAGRASPITWMATIARNRAIDRARALGVRPAASSAVEGEAEAVADEAPDPLSRLEAADDSRRLQDCLETLDERSRGAIQSAFLSGRSYGSLAEEAGIPAGTMKSIVRRALLRLRGCLES